jgi:hypothetical protein
MGVLPLFPLLVVALASSLVWLAGRRRLVMDRGRFRAAAAHALEAVGLTVAFLALDLALGVALALLARAAGRFVSLYLAADGTLVFLALLQALVFQRWWERGQDG